MYVPGSNHYDVRSCRPRLSRDLGIAANDGRLSDEEVERIYPRQYVGDSADRSEEASRAIHGNGIHKGPAWGVPGSPLNSAAHGDQAGFARVQSRSASATLKENRIRRIRIIERMSAIAEAFRRTAELVRGLKNEHCVQPVEHVITSRRSNMHLDSHSIARNHFADEESRRFSAAFWWPSSTPRRRMPPLPARKRIENIDFEFDLGVCIAARRRCTSARTPCPSWKP